MTANRRLGQIELSQGDYAAARQHLTAAAASAPDQRATELLLGELMAIDGQTDAAARMWYQLDISNGQLDGRSWWHGAIGETEAARRIKTAQERAKS